jgi:hypothetical protein
MVIVQVMLSSHKVFPATLKWYNSFYNFKAQRWCMRSGPRFSSIGADPSVSSASSTCSVDNPLTHCIMQGHTGPSTVRNGLRREYDDGGNRIPVPYTSLALCLPRTSYNMIY